MNEEHRHSSTALLAPAMVHFGETQTVLAQRQVVLDAAYRAHPGRILSRSISPPKCAPEEHATEDEPHDVSGMQSSSARLAQTLEERHQSEQFATFKPLS